MLFEITLRPQLSFLCKDHWKHNFGDGDFEETNSGCRRGVLQGGGGGGGSSRGGERIGEALGVLNQLVGIPDVRQAEPEDCPLSVNKTTITVFKIPAESDRERGRVGGTIKWIVHISKNPV